MVQICIIGRETVSYGGDLHFHEVEKIGNVRFVQSGTEAEIAEACRDADALLVNKTYIGEGLLSRLPKLKYVGIFATGYNNVDLSACQKYGVLCTNVPDYSTNAVAQHTLGFILSAAGAFPEYFDSVRRGDWCKSPTFSYHAYPTQEVYGKTLGIFGMGNIGKRVAVLASALGMHVAYASRSPKDLPYRRLEKEELFASSDFLSLHCALTEETENLIDERSLALMKKTAYLINTARGGLVDEVALRRALDEERIAGFYSDVVAVEPMRKDCPLFGARRCYLTPHTAWSPIDTRQALIGIAADNLRAFLSGTPRNVVV